MKLPIAIVSALLLSGHLPAQDTAYEALQDLVAERGERALENVVVVRGEDGTPQPAEWIVYRGPTNARAFQAAGIRSGGHVLSGVASAREVGLEPHAQKVNFTVLNLDSNSAWHIAKREARKENFRFGRVDYELKTNPLGGVPAWSLRLFNEKTRYVGELTLSGATGAVLHPLKLYRYSVEDEGGRETLLTTREPWIRRAGRSVGRWFSQTGTTYGRDMLRAAGTAEEILVGKRTRDYSEDAN